MYGEQTSRNFVQFKSEIKKRKERLKNFRMVINMGMVHDEIFLLCCLAKIALSREMFVIQIEVGTETFIPTELSQDQYPSAFRYYDSVLQMVLQRVSEQRKEWLSVKNNFNMQLIQKTDVKIKIFQKLGMSYDNKLTFKH